jgi:hypothetical protein
VEQITRGETHGEAAPMRRRSEQPSDSQARGAWGGALAGTGAERSGLARGRGAARALALADRGGPAGQRERTHPVGRREQGRAVRTWARTIAGSPRTRRGHRWSEGLFLVQPFKTPGASAGSEVTDDARQYRSAAKELPQRGQRVECRRPAQRRRWRPRGPGATTCAGQRTSPRGAWHWSGRE